MTKKRLLSGLLFAALLFSNGGAKAECAPLVYRVTDTAGRCIYLLGTIHIGEPSMYPLSEAVETAYRESDVLAVELDLYTFNQSILKSLRYSAALMYGPGEDVTSHLSPETYALGLEKLGVAPFMLKNMRPALWYSLAENLIYSQAGLSPDYGVDLHLLKRAWQDGKRVDELEGLDSQLNTLLALPDAALDFEIYQSLSNMEAAADAARGLMDAWETGDEEALLMYLGETAEIAPEDLDDAYADFLDTLLGMRNEDFEVLARGYLDRGEKALIAIGAGHIVGQDGLAARLSRAGYTVTEIGRE